MSNLCAYKPCKCLVPAADEFCSDICSMLGAQLVNRVKVSSELPLKRGAQVVPRCACGHKLCGDSLISGQVN